MNHDSNREKYLREDILTQLKEEFGETHVCVVSTEGYDLTTNPKERNSKKDRSNWADYVVKNLYGGIIRKDLSAEEYNFSYIKFGIDDKDNIYGLVSGKSKFHWLYPSDVWFYEFDGITKMELENHMKKNNMRWYEKEIVILKNKDGSSSKEAYENERKMKSMFGLFD